MSIRLPRPAAVMAAGLALTASACKVSFDEPRDPVSPTAVPFELVATGRVERSLALSLGVRRDGAESPFAGTTLSASPASAVRFEGDSTITPLESGRVLLIATQGASVDTLVLDVAVPPTVVFDRDEAGTHHIYSVTLDGRALTRLTTGASDDRYPSVGGARVVYASFSGGQSDLRSVALAGGPSAALTSTPAFFETEPSLSKDGSQLAFLRSDIGNGVPKLWIAAGDGTGARAAAPSFGTAGSADAAPRWAPDATRLAFVSTASGTSQLYVYARQSGVVSALGVGVGPNVSPSWNASGTTLAFASARGGAPGLYQTDATASSAIWLLRGNEGEPAWTTDGRLVFTDYTNGTGRLRWLDPADPSLAHEIDTGGGAAAHPVVVP